jgi:hypothetical protein
MLHQTGTNACILVLRGFGVIDWCLLPPPINFFRRQGLGGFKLATASSYHPADRYVLFSLDVDFAFQNIYQDGKPAVRRWRTE